VNFLIERFFKDVLEKEVKLNNFLDHLTQSLDIFMKLFEKHNLRNKSRDFEDLRYQIPDEMNDNTATQKKIYYNKTLNK